MFVGSGIPQFAEGHAAEICELSLDLISEALSFRTPLAPLLSLNLKISIHSGNLIIAFIFRYPEIQLPIRISIFRCFVVYSYAIQLIQSSRKAFSAVLRLSTNVGFVRYQNNHR